MISSRSSRVSSPSPRPTLGLSLSLAWALTLAAPGSAARADEASPFPVVFIGDSQSAGSFGRKLDGHLRTLPGARVHTVGSCSAIPDWYFTSQPTSCGYFERAADGQVTRATQHATPLLSTLIDEVGRPSLIVVELSGNLIGYPEASVRRQVRRVVSSVSAIFPRPRCVWVGTPSKRKNPPSSYNDIYRWIQQETAGVCAVFDSRPGTSYPPTGGDGTHYDTLPGGQGDAITTAWAGAVFDFIRSEITR